MNYNDDDKLIIRPSSIDNFTGCAQQWYRVFILGERSIPNARAAIGTAVHAGVAEYWEGAMKTGEKLESYSHVVDCAMEAFAEEEKLGLQFKDGENKGTAQKDILVGTESFVEDIVPFVTIPKAVEKRYTINIPGHSVVKALSGTVDYIEGSCIADVKTSTRKPTVGNYTTQQSIYRILANANGENITEGQIQGVVFRKSGKAEGMLLDANIDVVQSKALVNNLLDTLDVMAQDVVRPDVLFRGNPNYMFCSEKFCAFYNTCDFVKGPGAAAKYAASKNEEAQIVKVLENTEMANVKLDKA